MIRVVVVSGYPVVRAGMMRLLEGQEDITVVAESFDADEASALARELEPDVVLVDWGASRDEVASLRALAELPIKVIVVGEPVAELVPRVLEAGVRGYLLKEVPAEELAVAVRAVSQGLVVMHPAAAHHLARLAAQRAAASPTNPITETLSKRELEVLALVAQGLPNKTIANRLHLSEHTVKFHVASIIGKLGAASRTEAVTNAAKQGLITL